MKLQITLSFLLIFSCFYVCGSQELYSSRIEGSSLAVNGTYVALDSRYYEMSINPFWASSYTNYGVKNKVLLGINPDVVQSQTYSGTVGVEITYKQWVGGVFVDVVLNRVLSLNHSLSGGVLSDDVSTAVFAGGHYVSVKITSITGLSVSDLYLETQIEVERYYHFDQGLVSGVWHELKGFCDSYLEVSWQTKQGAEFYELEWVHVNDYTLVGGVYKATSDLEYNYYLNSTRVETSATHYQIPRLFDHGYVLYRIRAIAKGGSTFSSRLEGGWNVLESGTVSSHVGSQVYYNTQEYDPGMNWSYQAGYSEGTKRVESVSFSDGLGRARQSVVANPVTNQVVVSNVYYDQLGRGVISDLPTPVDQECMHHFADFNRANLQGEPSYQKDYFDVSPLEHCTPNSVGFSNNYGSGKYYSPNNPNQEGPNAYIPDAEHFPFSRVTYLNDFTGRVDRVSSLGETLSMGRGHETQMIYPSSNQVELNALFGVEVGDWSHYQKLVTIDANGQVYVSYSDLAGRVVATYLEGNSPANLDAIPQSPTTDVVVLLSPLGAQDIDLSVPSSELTYSEYIAIAGNYDFDYSMTPEQYTSICTGQGVCLDCVYDLEIRILDACGVEKKHILRTINGENLNALCSTPSAVTESFTLTLPQGFYTISKKLSVSQSALSTYWCYYIEDNTCLTPLATIFNSLYANEDFADCTTPVEEVDLSDETCSELRTVMLEDMMPGGQYGSYTQNGGLYSSSNTWSIYKQSNSFGHSWQTPDPLNPYLDANGVNVTTFVTSQGLTYDEQLTYFITHFQEQWAEGLLAFHPEYCYLQFCESNSASYAYNTLMQETYEFSAAKSSGYLKPLGNLYSAYWTGSGQGYNGVSTSLDPFFSSTGQGAAYATAMNTSMQSYITLIDPSNQSQVTLSLWEYALYKAMNCGSTVSIGTCLSGATDRTCELDMVWVIFRDAYLELKADYMYQAQNAYAVAHGCSNACIGAQTPCSGTASALSGYTPIWGNNAQSSTLATSMSTQSGATAVVTAQVQATCQSSCEQYADQWIAQLSGCDLATHLTTTQLTNLRLDFIAVCMEGCDVDHPLGSTTTPLGQPTPNGYHTLGDVLQAYLGSSYETLTCTDLLIGAPGVYKPTSELTSLVVQPLDICGCDILYAANEALSNTSPLPAGVYNLETMLAYGWHIELEDAHAMLCLCDKFRDASQASGWAVGANEGLIAQNMLVSADLHCDAVTTCQDCAAVNADLLALSQHFDYANYAAFTAAPNYQTLLTNYLNNLYHFDLTPSDYLNFVAGCTATSNAPVCTLNPLLDEWVDMMTLLSIGGHLQSPTSLNLNTANIVYAYGQLKATGLGHMYTTSLVGTTLTATFSEQSSSCQTILTLPLDATFGFSDIVSFGTIYPSTSGCTAANNTFDVEVKYYSCGVPLTGLVSGTTTCMEVNQCVCGDAGQLLCYDPYAVNPSVCYQPVLDELIQTAFEQYELEIAAQYEAFVLSYNTKCAASFSGEYMALEGAFNRYQYTLFYYDQAGNLARTVAPLGVNLLAPNSAIDLARDGVVSSTNYPAVVPGVTKPVHTYQSTYTYNSYNQLVTTTNPDQEGLTQFWYDRYGRIVASQNPEQGLINKYSYTLYDAQGRPVEVGQVISNSFPLDDDTHLKQDDLGSAFKLWVKAGTRSEVTVTTYDESLSTAIAAKFTSGQNFLRLRVATVAYFETATNGTNYQTDYQSALHYSYDVHGNVVEQLQDVPELLVVEQDLKSTQYEFELVSGNVKKVVYQKNKADQLTHSYQYDKLNRLTEVFTSVDQGTTEQRQAHYRYYDYGPVCRVELGQYKVQGMDFAYTINGWIKGMNSSLLNNNYEIGKDGRTGYLTQNNQVHELFCKDVVAYTLGYFNGDYKALDVNAQMEASYYTPTPSPGVHSAFDLASNNLYNGNIRNLVSSIYNQDPTKQTLGTAYRYDQLQRLKSMTAFYYSGSTQTTNDWFSATASTDYFNSYTYDKNGNIRTLQRNGTAATATTMDQFTYQYQDAINGGFNNRLTHVDDVVSGANYPDDIDDQGVSNYGYDRLGQLTSDATEGIANIEWRYGDKKIKKLTRLNGNTSEDLEFKYNPFGQRVIKISKPRTGGTPSAQSEWTYTYYTYDANGQVMATYNITLSTSDNKAILDEQHIYGASRLGMRKPNILLYDNAPISYAPSEITQNTLGETYYEISNYLGNVNAVITDRKIIPVIPGTSVYEAVVISTSDYYPFGMEMPEPRHHNYTSETYRFGYNGMEIDKEVSGNGNSYTTEFRQYDPRLGRWKSLDPLMAQFPHQSPYCAFDNNPILYVDPYGLEGEPVVGSKCYDESHNEVIQYDGDGNWSTVITELKEVSVTGFVFTDTKAPPGYGSVTGVGGNEFFIKSNRGAMYANRDVEHLGVSKGDMIEFRAYGKKFSAKFDEYNDFTGYYSKDGEVFEPHFMVGSTVYTGNSIQTMAGRDDKNNYTGNYSGIIDMGDEHLMELMAYGMCVFNIWNENKSKEETTLAESVGGELDYKHVLYEYFGWNEQALINYRGRVYNANEIGNLVWGLVLTNEGVLIDPSYLADAATHKLGAGSRHDEAHEQRAIRRGQRLSKKFDSKRRQAAIRSFVSYIRERYQK